MPDGPTTANTADLAVTEYDAERWARVHDERRPDPKKDAPIAAGETPEVGLSQKGSGEGAIVKRETEV